MRKLLFITLITISFISCKKDNSKNNTLALTLSGKYVSYKQIDTAYGNPPNVNTHSFLGDTLNFTSSTAAIESGNDYPKPNPFTYSLNTHLYNDGSAEYPNPDTYSIFVIDSETIELLTVEGTDNVSGNSWASYYKKL